jgi:hypothetical protein
LCGYKKNSTIGTQQCVCERNLKKNAQEPNHRRKKVEKMRKKTRKMKMNVLMDNAQLPKP